MRVFPACTNAAEILNIQVGKLLLLIDDNSEVDLNSAAAINARHATLSAQCQSYTETLYVLVGSSFENAKSFALRCFVYSLFSAHDPTCLICTRLKMLQGIVHTLKSFSH